MNKLFYYAKAFVALGLCTEESSDVFVKANTDVITELERLYKLGFLEIPNERPNAYNTMFELSLIDESYDKYCISILGLDIVDTAVKFYVEDNEELFKTNYKGAKKRDISSEMDSVKDYTLECLQEYNIEIKNVTEDRSNYIIAFTKRFNGIKTIEIKNAMEIRLVIRKPSKDLLDSLVNIGMKYREGPSQTYFDMPRTTDNVKLIVDIISEYYKG